MEQWFKEFIPTHFFDGNDWLEVNENKENWLEDREWFDMVHHIMHINDDLILIYWGDEFKEIFHLGKPQKAFHSTLYKGIIT